MGKRRSGRRLAMQALYQAEIRGIDIDLLLPDFLDVADCHQETIEWATFLATETWKKRPHIDPIISQHSTEWDFSRIHPVDKSILRLGLFELRYTQTPPGVVLNEQLELAKKYSTDDSAKFINGILGKIVEITCLPG